MLATTLTYALLGVEARPVRVEVDVRTGLPSFALVGLPDAAVRESRERVRAALVNSGFEFPQQRITANLAPADLRKAGPGYDLAIAAAILAATGQIPASALGGVALVGELALDGAVSDVPGAMLMAEAARRCGLRAIAVPASCAGEAALCGGIAVLPLERLVEVAGFGGEGEPAPAVPLPAATNGAGPSPDLADLLGQPALRRALEVAAAGGHSLLVTGPPGAGKSMAARRLPSILPPLEPAEALDAARVASACGRPVGAAVAGQRPFRAPHHTISTAGLIGGGNPPRPGEVTLAHRGVLFLDELPEFNRPALEALRQPLEDGSVRLARARYAVELPSRVQLVAAANPCPCGRGALSGECQCDPSAVRAYESKLTGALADRIDISLGVSQPELGDLTDCGEASAPVRERVLAARRRQHARNRRGCANAEVPAAELPLGGELRRLLSVLVAGGSLSGRGRERVIRVARTIADLDGAEQIERGHVEEALLLRRRAR